MSKNAPIIYIDKQVNRACTRFIKLNNYVLSNKRMTKHELKKLLDNLKEPLFLAQEGLNLSDEIINNKYL